MSFYTYKSILIFTIAASLTAACSSNPESDGATSAPSTATQQNNASGSDNAKVTYKIFRNFQAPEYPADGGPAKQR